MTTEATKTWVVSGNIGRFRQGQTLLEKIDIIDYLRICANEGDETIKLTDEQIWKVFNEKYEEAAAEGNAEDCDVVMGTAVTDADQVSRATE